jgi:cyclopropane fatty-acyl-phospholipid synthase-like methyltransferase
MSDLPDRIIGLYQRHASAWAKARGTKLIEDSWLDRFSEGLAPGAALLDLGCGPGQTIARYLADHGFRITGVDASRAMIDLFQGNLPGHEAVVADMRSLDLGRRFAGVLAWDSFFHLSHEDQRAMFPVFARHATPGARLIFTSGPSHGDAVGEFRGEPLYHASLAPEEYRELLRANGFEVVSHIPDDPNCGGHTVWLAQRA